MLKESAAWLIIRTLGLLCLGVSAFQAFDFLMNVIAIISYDAPVPGETIRLPNLRFDPLLGSLVFLALSVYFLKYGQAVHGWLLKEGRGGGNS